MNTALNTVCVLPLPTARRSTGPVHKMRPAAAADEGFEAAFLKACRPGGVGREALAALAAIAIERRFRAGERVVRRSERADAVWLLARGSVALGLLGDADTLAHVRAVEAGGWADAASALLDGSYLEDMVCETDALIWQLPMHALLACCARHPALMAALAAALALRVRQLTVGARVLMTKDVLARCATWLLDHALLREAAPGRSVGAVSLQQRKRTVALQLGTTPETFSRTLSQLSRQALIRVQGYEIVLLDPPALRALADGRPADAKGLPVHR